MLAKDKDTLIIDGIQPVDNIAQILKDRSSPSTISRVIDPNIRYTIEEVYKNEISFIQKQAQINVEDENKYIDVEKEKWAKGDEKKARYLKGYDIWSSLNSTSVSKISPLLKSLDKHELYVAVKFKDGHIELVANRPRTITRDGVKQKVIDELNPVELSYRLLEDKKPQGYGLSIEKLRQDEESLHDKKTLQWYKKNTQTITEEDENEDEEEVKDNNTPPQQPQQKQQVEEEQPTKETKIEEKSIKEDAVGQVVETLNSLVAPEEVQPEEVQTQQEAQQPEEASLNDFDDSEFVSDLIQEIIQQSNQIYKPQAKVVKINNMPQSVKNITSKPETEEQFVRYDDTQYDAPQPQEEKKEMATLHQMKMDNFKRAAGEIKQKIIELYNGDERRALQDADYIKLSSFVNETLKKQEQNQNFDDQKIDWALPQNKQIKEADFLNKQQSFAKTYNEDTFNSIEQRASNTF